MTVYRILHTEAATSFGGQERRIFKEMQAMRARGHHLEAVVQPDAELAVRLEADGFQVHTMAMDGLRAYGKAVMRIRRILRDGRFDVVNTHSRRDTMIGAVAGRLAKTPLIVRTRHLARRPNSLLSYTIIPHCVTTTSEFVRQQLLERRVDPDRVVTIYSPVEIKEPTDKGGLREALGLDNDDIVVGSVAVLRRPKGHPELIQAMLPLFRQNPRLHLVIVGDGEAMMPQLEALVATHNLHGRVHLLGRRNDVANCLADFDIFALATREEASGTVFVEAAAAGLPVVGTHVGGVAETMTVGESGFLVPLDDEAALTHALQSLIASPELRWSMGQAGRHFYQHSGRFTVDGMVQATEQAYGRWLAERRGGASP